MKHNLRHSADSINRWVDGTPTFEVTSITINYIRVISVTLHCQWICYSSCGSQPIQGCDGNWSKRRQSETSTTKTSSNQNVDKPKRRQTKLSTNQNVDRPKRRQTKTSTNQNVDKPKRRQTKMLTNQNVDRPKRRHLILVHCWDVLHISVPILHYYWGVRYISLYIADKELSHQAHMCIYVSSTSSMMHFLMCVLMCSIFGIGCVIEPCCYRALPRQKNYNLCEIF